MGKEQDREARGRRAALVVAGSALCFLLFTWLGERAGLGQGWLALIGLVAAAGFVFALWMCLQMWRARRNDRRPDGC